MAEKDTYDAAREAMREVTDHPERSPADTERLTRYLAGAAYHEEQTETRDKQTETRDKREEPVQEERS